MRVCVCVCVCYVCVFGKHACVHVCLMLERFITQEWTVSELLDRVMTEAESFVKEVTTHGDKGVVNYIKSCEMNSSYYLFI